MKPFFGKGKSSGGWGQDKRAGSGGYRGGAGGARKFGGGGGSGGGWQRNDDRDMSRGGGSSYDRPAMFPATCAACDAPCQVPFKPNGRKPIFCSDCFRKEDSASAPRFGGGDSERSARPMRSAPQSAGNDEIVKQLRTLNKKMDALIQIFLESDEEGEEEDEEGEAEEVDMDEVGFDDEVEEAEEAEETEESEA